MPEGTINAVGLIVAYLREAEDAFGARDERLLTPAEHEFVKFLAFVHADAYGRGLGIDATSPAFGPLTCNPGVIRVVDGHIEQVIDEAMNEYAKPIEIEVTFTAEPDDE